MTGIRAARDNDSVSRFGGITVVTPGCFESALQNDLAAAGILILPFFLGIWAAAPVQFSYASRASVPGCAACEPRRK